MELLQASWVKSISNTGLDGQKLSDHFGVAINIETSS
jgi:hypothetical protein